MYESEYTFKFNYHESDWLSTFIAVNPKEYQQTQSNSNQDLVRCREYSLYKSQKFRENKNLTSISRYFT